MTKPDENQRQRILIVDDDETNRRLLEWMLSADGYVCESAAGGDEALTLIGNRPPDLILLDVMMPIMDGYEVARRLKRNSATMNIPIIMITALSDRVARLEGLNAGAEDVLTKPVDRAELGVRVRNLLRLKEHGDYHIEHGRMLQTEVQERRAALRRSDVALREQQNRAQQYLDTAAVFLVALDTEHRITLVNQYACTLLEQSADDLVGRDWFEACVPTRLHAAQIVRFYDILNGDDTPRENPVVTKSGGERMIEWRNTLLHDAEGKVTGFLSSGVDVTERQLAEAALRASEEHTRFAMDSAGVGTWFLDYATGQVRWSHIMEAQYGMSPGTFPGTFEAFAERIHPDDRVAALAVIAEAAQAGGDFSVQHRIVWPDGTERWVRGSGRYFLRADGTAERAVGISIDFTDRRTLEAQYQQAQKMEAVGRLASGVAHDFNNLLTVITGFAEFIQADTTIADQHKEDATEIIKAANRATGLTQQLLAYSRQQVLLTAPFDVNGTIIGMTGMLGRLIGADIEIVLSLEPAISAALGDSAQFEQVVMNLVVNARDAMPDGGVLRIETQEVELENSPFHAEEVTPGAYVMVAVSDTGTGMTKEVQQRLFEPFYTTKSAGQGTGLGLSTTYGIVKQSKGHIWVYSELGAGTMFKVFLPRSSEIVPILGKRRDEGPPRERKSATILLVEDEPGVRQFSSRILTRAGYQVLEASDGDDAEKIFHERAATIDLVVTDVVMPGCGGPELLARLHRLSPDLRVLYMSGYTEQAVAHKIGKDRVKLIQKPFTAAELLSQVRKALTDTPALGVSSAIAS